MPDPPQINISTSIIALEVSRVISLIDCSIKPGTEEILETGGFLLSPLTFVIFINFAPNSTSFIKRWEK